ncbi:MAG: DnaJ family domain-containing protein [Burkholderiales bacterium]
MLAPDLLAERKIEEALAHGDFDDLPGAGRPRSLALLLTLLVLPFAAANAIDPGTAQGTLRVDGKAVTLRHSYAHRHDNVEGLLDRPRELRILLADREVPQSALIGIAFLPATGMAREGKLQGLLLQLDPEDRSKAVVTLLYPAPAGQSLMTLTTGGAFKRLEIASLRVVGEIERRDERKTGSPGMPALDFSLRFSAPVFHEPTVTADLKGKAAQESEQVRALRSKARAFAKGDLEAARRLSTERSNRQFDAFLAQAGKQAAAIIKEGARDMEKSVGSIRRVVVRGDRAVAIAGDNEWFTFAREGADWKLDD